MVKKQTGWKPRKAGLWDRFLDWLTVQAENAEKDKQERLKRGEKHEDGVLKAMQEAQARHAKAMQDDYEWRRRREEENRWRQNR